MKDFHRNHVIRPTELEKKERDKRAKRENKEGCKCLAPFVRLHYYDCPAVKKSCPVHGNHRYRAPRYDKGEPEKNMIISFHPSSKTERLFQPVKTLLAHCTPDTKVNLQYYSPKSTTSKESIKHEDIQNRSDDGRKPLNNSIFVEKTKSYVADKTNKMKKLKQCFHSPCNSIAHKSRSQTSIRERFKEIFRDDVKQGNLSPEKPPDDLRHESNLAWFSNKLDFKDWEKLSRDNIDSDFLTVTQKTKNNLINHKIFEIKHKKGLNDYPFFKLPEQPSHLVYSSLDMNHPMQKARNSSDQGEKKIYFENSPPSEGKPRGDSDLSSLENLHTSSSSSVYFTPFIFVPAVGDEVQMETKEHGDGKKETVAQETQTPSQQSDKDIIEEPKTTSVQLQTDVERQSGDSATPEWYLRSLEVADSFTTRGTQTDESLFRMDKCVGDSRRLSELSSEIFASPSRNGMWDLKEQGTQTSSSPAGSQGWSKRTVQVQPSRRRRPQGGVLNSTTWTMTTLDKVVQTESCNTLEIRRMWSFKVNKSQMASPKLSNKTTQTIFSRSESLEEVSEFIDLDSSNVTFVVKPFDNQESDQAIDKLSKAWWGKSHSDSQLYVSSKCSCFKPESVIRIPQSCSCNRSETTDEKNTSSFWSKEKSSSRDVKPKRKADKSLGANDGSQRSYRRAEKALGTDSAVEAFGKADKALGTDSGIMKMSRKVDKALGTENDLPGPSRPAGKAPASQKADKSPRKTECQCQAEELLFKEEPPPIPPLSDLSELTKIIQDFFKKMDKQPWRPCPCESSSPERRTEKMATPRKENKESVDHSVGHRRQADAPDAPKKPKEESVNAETQVVSPTKGVLVTDKSASRPPTERVKIRRSVLLDDNEPRTRFVCSVCAREISTYSTNAATNTENPQNSPRKKLVPNTVSTEISELIKVKSVTTFQSYDDPKRLTSAPEPTARAQDRDAKEGTSQLTYRGSGNPKTYIPTPRPTPAATTSDRAPQVVKPDSLKGKPTVATSKPINCICEQEMEVCTKDSCPNREASPSVPTTSRGAQPRTERHSSTFRAEHSGTPGTQTNGRKRSSDKTRTHRRTLEPYFPVFIRSPWPRDFTWNVPGSQSSVPEEWESSTTLQQERSCSRESEPADASDGKKIEFDKSLGQYFVLGSATSRDLRMGDHIILPNKGGFILIPSLSASSIDPPRKHSLSQSKMTRSKEKTSEPNELQPPPEGSKGPSDLSSTTSCHLTPLRSDCDDRPSECRLCKSLTFLKTDRESVVFHWRHGMLAYRPTAPQNPTATRGRREDSEWLHPNESSTQNLDVLLEESPPSTERSDSPSPYELLPEDTSEEEQNSRPRKGGSGRRNNDAAPPLSDIFCSNAAVDAKSLDSLWAEEYRKKERKPDN